VARYAFGRRLGAGLAAAAAFLLVSGLPADAASDASGVYADMSVSGSSGAFTGSADMSAAGFPSAKITSDATSVKAPSGQSAFQGPATPVGAVYGSSRGDTYLNISTAKGVTTSTTTLDFDSATPAANWAFVLGDIDADSVEISGIDADGNPISAADLGFEGVYNYCADSPKPSGCTGSGPFTDVPTWHPGSSKLTGNGPDTLGAAGWFQPKVAVKSLTFKFTALTGIPVYQLWLTTLTVPVEMKVDGITPDNPVPAPGVEVDLLEPDGVTPVEEPDGKPVIEIADPKGDVEFPAVSDGDYVLKIVPPKHVRTLGKTTIAITVDVAKGSPKIPSGTFRLVVPLQLAKTGANATPAIAAGVALVLLGGILVWLSATFGRRARREAIGGDVRDLPESG
jgi:hypothetical protein